MEHRAAVTRLVLRAAIGREVWDFGRAIRASRRRWGQRIAPPWGARLVFRTTSGRGINASRAPPSGARLKIGAAIRRVIAPPLGSTHSVAVGHALEASFRHGCGIIALRRYQARDRRIAPPSGHIIDTSRRCQVRDWCFALPLARTSRRCRAQDWSVTPSSGARLVLRTAIKCAITALRCHWARN